MQQFDIVENLSPLSRGRYPFLILLQHHRASSISTLVAAPLTEPKPTLTRSRLHPIIKVNDRDFVLITEELAAVQRRIFGNIVGSAEPERYAVIAALDLLFTGI